MATTVQLYADKRYVFKERIPAYIRLTHERKQMLINLNIQINPQHFNFDTCQCTKQHADYITKNQSLNQKKEIAEKAIEVLQNRPYTPDSLRDHVAVKLKSGISSATLGFIAAELVEEQRQLRRASNAKHVEWVVKKFNEWDGRGPILIDNEWKDRSRPLIDIDYRTLNKYKTWLLTISSTGNGISANAVRSYFMALQSVFTYAKKIKAFPKDSDLWPFLEGLIPPKSRAGKRQAFTSDIVKKLEELRLSLKPNTNIRLTCDFTLLQFYLHGVDFVELAMARKEHITDGYWIFKRYKNRNDKKGETAPEVRVKVTDKAFLILSQYNHPDLLIPVLDGFPVLKNGTIDTETDKAHYKTRYDRLLKHQRQLGAMVGTHISTKSMRYLWASRARILGVSREIIDIGQGHVVEGMSEPYTNNPHVENQIQQELNDANEKIQSL